MSADLAGMGVAVTGAAGDIGNAMAVELAHRGAQVALIDRVPEGEAAERIAAVAVAGDRGLQRLEGRAADAGPVDGAGARAVRDPRQCRRAGDRVRGDGEAPVRLRSGLRAACVGRRPARRARHHRAGRAGDGVPVLPRVGLHDGLGPARGRRRVALQPRMTIAELAARCNALYTAAIADILDRRGFTKLTLPPDLLPLPPGTRPAGPVHPI